MGRMADGSRLSEFSNDLFEIVKHGSMYAIDLIFMECDRCGCTFKATPGYYNIHRKYIGWLGDYKFTFEARCPECGATVIEMEED